MSRSPPPTRYRRRGPWPTSWRSFVRARAGRWRWSAAASSCVTASPPASSTTSSCRSIPSFSVAARRSSPRARAALHSRSYTSDDIRRGSCSSSIASSAAPPSLAVEPLDLLDVGGHRLVARHALQLRPCVVLGAADEVQAARAVTPNVAFGRLLVVGVQLEHRRVVGTALALLRRCRGRLEA